MKNLRTGRNRTVLRTICREGLNILNSRNVPKATERIINLYKNTLSKIGLTAKNYKVTYTRVSGIVINKSVVVNTLNGINTTYSQKVVNSLFAQLKKVPFKLANLVGTINIYDTFNPDDFFWEQEYNKPNFNSAARFIRTY